MWRCEVVKYYWTIFSHSPYDSFAVGIVRIRPGRQRMETFHWVMERWFTPTSWTAVVSLPLGSKQCKDSSLESHWGMVTCCNSCRLDAGVWFLVNISAGQWSPPSMKQSNINSSNLEAGQKRKQYNHNNIINWFTSRGIKLGAGMVVTLPSVLCIDQFQIQNSSVLFSFSCLIYHSYQVFINIWKGIKY